MIVLLGGEKEVLCTQELILGDDSRAAELENLHLEIGSRIRDMELNKNFLENRLDE